MHGNLCHLPRSGASRAPQRLPPPTMFDSFSPSSPTHLTPEQAARKSAHGRAHTATKGHQSVRACDANSSWLSDLSSITYGGQRSVLTGTTIAAMAVRHRKFQQSLADLQKKSEDEKRERRRRRAARKRAKKRRGAKGSPVSAEWTGSDDEEGGGEGEGEGEGGGGGGVGGGGEGGGGEGGGAGGGEGGGGEGAATIS